MEVEDIRRLFEGRISLRKLLEDQIQVLEEEKSDVDFAQEICRRMKKEEISIVDLDAAKYLGPLERQSESTGTGYFTRKRDRMPQVFSPWRRCLARWIDYSLYSLLWDAVLVLFLHVNISTRGILGDLLDIAVTLGLMILVEPFLLSRVGTTPGKAVFGLKIFSPEGGRLTYHEALLRTYLVLKVGMGFQIPFYGLYRMYKSYKVCSEEEILLWDEEISYTMKDEEPFRAVLFLGAQAAIVGFIFLLLQAELIPPNRGELTIAEFVENYNHYQDLMGIESDTFRLTETGEWVDIRKSSGYYDDERNMYYTTGYEEKPLFRFELSHGVIRSMSFDISIRNKKDMLLNYNNHMILCYLALAGAREEMNPRTRTLSEAGSYVTDNTFQGFTLEKYGLKVKSEEEYIGYTSAGAMLFPEDDAKEHFYSLFFSVENP